MIEARTDNMALPRDTLQRSFFITQQEILRKLV